MYSISAKPEQIFSHPSSMGQSAMKVFFQKLDRMFTAIAYAEAGNLDAVKEILEQGRKKSRGVQ